MDAKLYDKEIDEEERKDHHFIQLDNIHKTYLLGVEGITALRSVLLPFPSPSSVLLFFFFSLISHD
jgi:hypothetical protein